MWKKSTSFLIGFQAKYFRVIANGSYLVYYNHVLGHKIESMDDLKPDGVFEIEKISDLQKDKESPVNFSFKYGPRVFEFKTES